jgi:hypothetical protein
MVGEPQGAMRGTSQIWQVFFASQTLPVFCLALRKKAQYVIVLHDNVMHYFAISQFDKSLQSLRNMFFTFKKSK